jgi:prepilin-type N-terminal cleavage/methylation domain-containing protein
MIGQKANNSSLTTNRQQLLVSRCKLAVGNCKLPFRRAFTLVEVLVVVGLIAVLTTVVLLTLNPLDFLKQGRDSTRLNDLSNLLRTLNYIKAESPQTFFGNPKTIYISRPDPNLTGDSTSTCPNMNLPSLPNDYSYQCVSQENLKKTDGKGWIPIDFRNQAIFRLSKLPTDPKNDENYYYTYVYDPNTQSFEIDTVLESKKQKHLLSKDNGDNDNLYELGTNLTLYPIGGIGQNLVLKNESSQNVKNESNFLIYVAQAAGTGQVSFFIAPDQVTGDNNLFWDNTNKRLGIWTTSPGSRLSVSGGVSIGSTYAGTAAPVDGLIVQGNVGIGTTTPSVSLHVATGDTILGGSNLILGRIGGGSPTIRPANGNIIIDNWGVGYGVYLRGGTGIFFQNSGGSPEYMRITSTGNVGIGTTTPAYKLDVFGDIRTTGCLVYNGGTLGTCASDIRLKDNIMNLTFDNAIEKVIKLQPKKFVFKQDPNHEMHGLIAQEVEEFAPELITTDQNGYKQIKYGDIQWLMLQTIQEQQKTIENQQKLIESQQKQIDGLKHRIEILEKK